MKLVYDGREVNRISVETLNDDCARGSFFARKLIEFADGEKLYVTERIEAGGNIVFPQGENALIGWLFGAPSIEGKEIAVFAEVTQGTALGKRLPCTVTMSGGTLRLRVSPWPERTIEAVRILINNKAAAEITGLPSVPGKSIVITINRAVS